MKQIETTLWKPNPDKPGYVVIDRTLTHKELDAAIQRAMPSGLKDQWEWSGPPATMKILQQTDTPLPPHDKVMVEWCPGSSEGYIANIYVTDYYNRKPLECVWHAKMFDFKVAHATAMMLMALLTANGTGMMNWLLNQVAQMLGKPCYSVETTSS
jgi:hypothetical protein